MFCRAGRFCGRKPVCKILWWRAPPGRWQLPVLATETVNRTTGATTALKLALPKATPPKKITPKGGVPWYDYEVVDAKSGLRNPSSATLAYTAKTGLFKGTFKLHYEGVDAKGAPQLKSFGVSYAGVMVPNGGKLTGLATGTATVNREKFEVSVILE